MRHDPAGAPIALPHREGLHTRDLHLLRAGVRDTGVQAGLVVRDPPVIEVAVEVHREVPDIAVVQEDLPEVPEVTGVPEVRSDHPEEVAPAAEDVPEVEEADNNNSIILI